MQKQMKDEAEMLIRHQIELLQHEYKRLDDLNSSEISRLLTRTINFYVEMQGIGYALERSEVFDDVARQNV